MFKKIFLSDLTEGDAEDLIQIISPDEDTKLKDDEVPEEVGLLPIRNTVLFPGVVIPITVGREKSIKLVKKAFKGDRIIGVVAQKNV
ncbi:MAG: LON peptidase substrate-binding domain-containing protein, partial [Fulvivirga sp.]